MKQAVVIKTVPVNIFFKTGLRANVKCFHLHGRHLQYVLLGGITTV